MTGGRPPELRALTGARGIAAWLVVLYHLRRSIPGLPPALEAVFARGYLAVDFFFLLSGFVIQLAWADRLRASGGTAAFWRKRVARVWPLHALMLAAALALATALRVTGRDASHYPLDQLPLHLLLVQCWGFSDPLLWNDPAWSISAEWLAYLLFPLLPALVDWRRWSNAALLAAAAAILVALHLEMRGEPSLGADIGRFGAIRCLAEFAVGGIVCVLWQRAPHRAFAPAAIAAACFAASLLGAAQTLAVPAAFAASLWFLAATAGRRGNPLDTPALHRLGEISYATYLSHFLLWNAFKFAVVEDAATPTHIASYLVLVLVASVVLYDRFERPSQRWVERLALPSVRERSRSPTHSQ